MARLPRYFVKGVPLHIILRGNNREPIFANDEDCQFFKESLLDAAARHGLSIHAYVFMTNHVHLLASPGAEDSVPKALQSVGRRYVQYFNFRYQRTGTLWEGRYRATVADAEHYLFECMRYIELNPVRAGMVANPRDYAWSSYQANAHGKANELVSAHSLYRHLAREEEERLAAYRALFKAPMDQHVMDAIRDCTNQISQDVKSEIANALNIGREVTVHAKDITINGWTGSGYLIIDPDTGAGAYKIAGGANGGFLVAFILTVIAILVVVFVIYPMSTVAAVVVGIWELINVILWIRGMNQAQNDTDFNKANAGQAIGAMLGFLPTGGVALAEIVKWFGLLFALMLTSFL